MLCNQTSSVFSRINHASFGKRRQSPMNTNSLAERCVSALRTSIGVGPAHPANKKCAASENSQARTQIDNKSCQLALSDITYTNGATPELTDVIEHFRVAATK